MSYDPSLFGEAKEQFTRTRNHRLVDGDNQYRIGPAFRSLASSGRWNQYIKQHWGYRGEGDEQNPNGFPRLFICPEEIDRNTEMVKVACAECSKRNAAQDEVDRLKQKYMDEGKTEEQINTILSARLEWLKAHNLDKKYLVLAKNTKGEWGVLWLPYKAKEAFDVLQKQLKAKEGINPLGMTDGLWVNFNRTGKGRNTVYTCTPVYEEVEVNGRKLKDYKRDTLVEADFVQMQNECPDLTTVGTRLTGEQIEQLVECDGDPEEVDRIFKSGRKEGSANKEQSASPRKAAPEVAPTKAIPKVAPKASPTPEPVAGFTPVEEPSKEKAASVVDDEEATLLAQLEAARQRKADAQKKAAAALVEKVEKKAPANLPDIKDVKNLPDDEFFKLFPKKA